MTIGMLWREGRPLVLASGSQTRLAMLVAAGLPVLADPARIDERQVEREIDPAIAAPGVIAEQLALAKAQEVSARHPSSIVLGADQTLDHGGVCLHKPDDLAAARHQLAAMAGQTHMLHSGFALVRDGQRIASGVAAATLTMRPLSDEALDAYLAAAGPDILASVGGYQLERLGVHLFTAIEGDHFTILGLPLLQVLAALRAADALI
jgi:septum formation protein